jgi:S-adenosyl-L-methionine hydrolase (adenosine-forming)
MLQSTRPIVFATDFGYRNEWVGICHAVMSRIAPGSRIVDLSHGVPPLDVLAGALLLVDSLPYVSEDAVVVAIVDPNVGKDRDIALETKSGRLLVGPDNGLLIPVSASLGGIERGFEITAEQIIIQPVAPSFHARDVLCPAAAHLAAGMAIEELGPALDPGTLVQLSVPEPVVEAGKVQGEVLDMNRFGNVELNVREEHLAAAGLDGLDQLAIEAASGSARARRATTYADVDPDEYGVFVDHRRWLAVIRGNPGNAAAGLGVQVGDLVWITPLPSTTDDEDRAREREPETESGEQLVERFPL